MARLRIAPPRLALAATWLAAVAVSTAIGLLAVNTVGDAASDRGPLGPSALVVESPGPRVDSPSPRPGGREVRRVFRYEFGSFTAACNGPFVRLIDNDPAPGWKLDSIEPDPDDDVEIGFTDGTQEVEAEVFCNRGQPDIAQLDRKLINRP